MLRRKNQAKRAPLALESLEARRVLSSQSLASYDLPTAVWFGAPIESAAEVASLPIGDESSLQEWIVRLTPEGTAQAGGVRGASRVLGDLGFDYQVQAGLGLPGQILVTTRAVGEQIVRQAFAENWSVAYAGLNAAITGTALHPNDAAYTQGRLFGLNLTPESGIDLGGVDSDIDAPEAWQTTTGSDSVVIAILDSGVDYRHEDLAANIWSDGVGGHGYDFYADDDDPLDENGHGTHVAGIIGAKGNNAIGVTGVNWDASLLPIRVLGPQNTGTVAQAIQGITYAVSLAKREVNPVNVRVINASWAVVGQFVDQNTRLALTQAIATAGAANILFLAAAGNGDILNNGQDLNSHSYLPASIERDQATTLDNLVVVAASDPYDRLPYFSNYGAGIVDLAAPGVAIQSTLPGGAYGYHDGTSMATAYVSGAAALVLSNQPDLTAGEVREALVHSVDLLATPDDRAKVASQGRLNLAKAVEYTAFAPRAAVQAAVDITSPNTPGSENHTITIRYTGKTAIDTTTLGLDDLVVRKSPNGDVLTLQSISSAVVGGNPNIVDATYGIAGPGDAIWNSQDNGSYQVEILADGVFDTAGPNRPAEGTDYAVLESAFAVNIAQGLFRVQRTDDGVDANPGNGVPDVAGEGVGFTLRGALQEANLVPNSTIVIPSGVYALSIPGAAEDGTLSGDLDVTGSVTIASDGSGTVIIDGAALDRLFDVQPGATLQLEGVTIRNGNNAMTDGGGIRNRGTLSINRSVLRDNVTQHNGGGIFNAGTLHITETTIWGNVAATNGGGVFNAAGGQTNIQSSTLADNAATGETVFDFRENGAAFRVSTTTGGARHDPRISVNSSGQAVVVWSSNDAGGENVFGQKLDAAGAKEGPQFQLNSTHVGPGPAELPDVALDDDGNFGTIFELDSGAPLSADIGFRGFDWTAGSAPTPTTPLTVSETALIGHQNRSRIARTDDDGYLLVWTDLAGNDGSGFGIMARRVDRNGVGGPSFPVTGVGHQLSANVAKLSSGEIIVTYQQQAADGTYDVFARRFNGLGVAIVEPPIPLNSETAGDQTYADVTAIENGFVAAWYGTNGVRVRVFDKTGVPQTGEIPISNQVTPGKFYSLATAALPDDSFVVVWGNVLQQGANNNRLYLQRVGNDGTLIGDLQTVTTTAAFAVAGPAIDLDASGKGYIVWDGSGFGDSSGIVAQPFAYVLEPTGLGGGVYNAGVLSAANATISSNTSADSGGGLYNAESGSTTFQHVTISRNQGVAGAGIASANGGSVVLKNSLVADNSSPEAPDLSGAFSSTGSGNFIGNVGGATGLTHAVNGNKVGTSEAVLDAKLGPLAANGGLTSTHAPAVDSPVIDAGLPANALSLDQRGVVRPVDGDANGSSVVDVGAVENYFASIHGKKFNDRNGNGIQDSGEEGLADWTLYLDVNLNGRWDATEPFTTTISDDPATQSVDEEGNYAFIGLSPGPHRVAEIPRAGWERTYVSPALVQDLADGLAGVDGLLGARALAATSDQTYVYAAGADESKIARFKTNAATGELTFLGVTTTSQTVAGWNVLDAVEQIAVSAVGTANYLYALSAHGALSVFNVDPSTGDLALSQVFRHGDAINLSMLELLDATGLAASPDGQSVYVSNSGPSTTNGGVLLVFERSSGSQLIFRRQLANSAGVFGAGGRGVAVSPDNAFVYVAAATSDSFDSVAVFKRVAGPAYLSFQSIVRNNQNDARGNLVHGLDGAAAVAVSPDGLHLYATGPVDNSVVVFERNLSSGALTFVQELADGAVDYQGNQLVGLRAAWAIAVSGDGRRLYASGKIIDESDPVNPIFAGGVAVFRRDPASGRLTFHEFLVDGSKDDFGVNYEYLDSVSAVLAPHSQFVYLASSDFENALTLLNRDGEGLDDLTLRVGEVRTDVDFAAKAIPGSVFGKVFDNRDGNAQQGVDEPSLSGRQVYLDLNNNGVRDSLNGLFEPVAVTDSTGVYSFEEAPVGAAFTVRLIAKAGWVVTAPVAPIAGAYSITLAPGEIALQKDFGVTIQGVIGAGTGGFKGVAFQDLDGDGLQAPFAEPGIGGLRVFLDLNDDGVRDDAEAVVVTNSNSSFGPIGEYTFSGVPDSAFTIRIDPADLSAGQQLAAPVGNTLVEQAYSLNTSINPSQVVYADFDKDQDLDLAVLTLDGVVSIFRNNGSGQFTTAPIRLPNFIGATSMAIGDFNGDSRPDIALASSSISKVAIAMNDPASPPEGLAFTAYSTLTTTLANWDLTAADLSGDGRADLALAQRSPVLTNPSQVLVLHSTTTSLVPSFTLAQTIAVGRQPRSLQAAQVDNAGGLDLLLANQFDRTIQVVLKSGTTFVAQSPIAVQTGSAVDAPFVIRGAHLSDDAKLDLVVGNSNTSAVSVLLGSSNTIYGPGGYTLLGGQPLDAKGLPRDVVIADIDADLDLDIVVGTVGPAGITIFRNAGTPASPSFQQPEVRGVANLRTSDLPGVKSLAAADFAKNGGPLEIAAVSGSIDAGALLVYANSKTSGAYRVATNGAQLGDLNFAVVAASAPGDYDGDADRDGGDFLLWQRTFGSPAVPPGSGADGNSSGKVDGTDLTIWETWFGQPDAAENLASANLVVDGFLAPRASNLDAGVHGTGLQALRDNAFIDEMEFRAEHAVESRATRRSRDFFRRPELALPDYGTRRSAADQNRRPDALSIRDRLLEVEFDTTEKRPPRRPSYQEFRASGRCLNTECVDIAITDLGF